MKKILIVSYYFPPLNLIAAKRYGTMCKYFEEYGFEPYIITTKHDRAFIEWNVRFDLKLPVSQKQIIQLGKSKKNHEIKNRLIRFILQLLASNNIASGTVGTRAFGWFTEVKKNIDFNAIKDVDIVIGTYPGMENLYVARYLAKKIKCPYIVDIRDLISDYKETPGSTKNIRWIDRIIEKYILGEASGIIAVTPGFRNILKKRYPNKKFEVVFNGYDNLEKVRKVNTTSAEKILYYAGSLYMHRLESFELLVQCLSKINLKMNEKIRLVVRSIGPKALDLKAKKIVQREKVQEFVTILGAVSEEVIRQEQQNSYINIIFSTIHEYDEALVTTIPGKLYEMLNMNPPILAIAPGRSDINYILENTRKGIATVLEEEIIRFILKGNNEYTGNGNITCFTRKRQAKRFCKFVNEVLEDI